MFNRDPRGANRYLRLKEVYKAIIDYLTPYVDRFEGSMISLRYLDRLNKKYHKEYKRLLKLYTYRINKLKEGVI